MAADKHVGTIGTGRMVADRHFGTMDTSRVTADRHVGTMHKGRMAADRHIWEPSKADVVCMKTLLTIPYNEFSKTYKERLLK